MELKGGGGGGGNIGENRNSGMMAMGRDGENNGGGRWGYYNGKTEVQEGMAREERRKESVVVVAKNG